MKYTQSLTFLLFLFIQIQCFGQWNPSVALDQYVGIPAAQWNPSFSSGLSDKWNIQLFSAGVSVRNNYAFLIQKKLTNLFDSNAEYLGVPEIIEGAQVPEGASIYDYYYNTKNKYLNLQGYLSSPGLILTLNDQWHVGIWGNMRTSVSTRRFGYPIDYYHFDETPFYVPILTQPTTTAFMAWSEIATHASYKQDDEYNSSWGINLKLLFGHEAAYVRNVSNTYITQLPNDSFRLREANLFYSFTTSQLDGSSRRLQNNGKGIAVDLGWSRFEEDDDGLRWRLGVSLNDLGWISFNKNAQAHHLITSDSFTIYQPVYLDTFDIINKAQQLSNQVMGEPGASFIGNSFSMATPASLQASADFRVAPGFIVSAALGLSIPLGYYQSRIQSFLTVMPRLETKWFHLAAPLTYRLGDKLRFGTTVRLGWFIIGSEDLLSWTAAQNKLNGGNIFIGIQIGGLNFLGKNNQTQYYRPRKSSKRVRCPKF